MSSKWKKTLFTVPNKQKKYIATTANVDSLFEEKASYLSNYKVTSGDDLDYRRIDRENQKKDLARKRAAKLVEQNTSFTIDSIFDDGISKVASDVSSGGGDVETASSADFYSPWLSTDYLELPRSYAEERRWYRFFYDQDPVIGRAIDLKTYIPLSKMELSTPICSDHVKGQQVLAFFERMWSNLKLRSKIRDILHEYNLIGEVLIYFEWDDEEKEWVKAFLLDPDTCEVRYLPYQDEIEVYWTPDNSIRETISDLRENDEFNNLADILEEISDETGYDSDISVKKLNTDPRQGSFVAYLARQRSPNRPGPGVSILRRLLRTLLFRDKIRQAMTQIVSRNMTPIRLVWGENLSPEDVDDLRMQVDLALTGPDFSIITNYQVNWEEKTPEGRLFDASAVNEQTMEQLLIGLGLTKELLFGEGTYGGGRITLQVLDTEYSLVRDLITDLVDDVFKVCAEKNGFIEEDEETGIETVVYPNLKFARMSLKDYADIFDFMWNMYQNGSLDRDTMLEFLNLDPIDVSNKLKKNFLTIDDNLADEFRRSVYSEITSKVVEDTNILDKVIAGFGLDRKVSSTSEEGVEGEDAGFNPEDFEQGFSPEDFGETAEPDMEDVVSEEVEE